MSAELEPVHEGFIFDARPDEHPMYEGIFEGDQPFKIERPEQTLGRLEYLQAQQQIEILITLGNLGLRASQIAEIYEAFLETQQDAWDFVTFGIEADNAEHHPDNEKYNEAIFFAEEAVDEAAEREESSPLEWLRRLFRRTPPNEIGMLTLGSMEESAKLEMLKKLTEHFETSGRGVERAVEWARGVWARR